jgi:hypothetical protein
MVHTSTASRYDGVVNIERVSAGSPLHGSIL